MHVVVVVVAHPRLGRLCLHLVVVVVVIVVVGLILD